MELYAILLLLVIIFIVLLFKYAVRVKLVFDTDKSDMRVAAQWLEPFVKVFLSIENDRPVLKVLVFNKVLFDKKIKKNPSNRTKEENKQRLTDLIRQVKLREVNVNLRYGFSDPYNTGILCGALSSASQFIGIDQLSYSPDFTAATDYIYLDATAKFNPGRALLGYLRHRT